MNFKKTKIIELNGGLGNQLFQYSLGLYLKRKKNYDIFFDKSFFRTKFYAPVVRIDKVFKLNLKEINKKNFELKYKILSNNKIIKILQSLSSKLVEYLGIFVEKNLPFDERIKLSENFFYFRGYFQSEKYFLDIKKYLKEKIKLKVKINKKSILVLKKIKRNSSVCVHIRRKDYVDRPEIEKIHRVCDKNYYLKAIDILKKKINKPILFFFSDDPEWTKKNFGHLKQTYIINFNKNKSNHVIDFELMRNCKHFIISNSSFSWWACWLGSNKKSYIISPKNWFKDKYQKRNPILKSWIKI